MVMPDVILGLIVFLPHLNPKHIELHSQYLGPRKYLLMVSLLLSKDHELLLHTFRRVWMFVVLLYINHITNMLYTKDLVLG